MKLPMIKTTTKIEKKEEKYPFLDPLRGSMFKIYSFFFCYLFDIN